MACVAVQCAYKRRYERRFRALTAEVFSYDTVFEPEFIESCVADILPHAPYFLDEPACNCGFETGPDAFLQFRHRWVYDHPFDVVRRFSARAFWYLPMPLDYFERAYKASAVLWIKLCRTPRVVRFYPGKQLVVRERVEFLPQPLIMRCCGRESEEEGIEIEMRSPGKDGEFPASSYLHNESGRICDEIPCTVCVPRIADIDEVVGNTTHLLGVRFLGADIEHAVYLSGIDGYHLAASLLSQGDCAS